MTQSGHDGDNADVTDSLLRDNKFTHIAAYFSPADPKSLDTSENEFELAKLEKNALDPPRQFVVE